MYIYLVQKKNRAFNSLEEARNYIVTYLADRGAVWTMMRGHDEEFKVPEYWKLTKCPEFFSMHNTDLFIHRVEVNEQAGRCSTCKFWKNYTTCTFECPVDYFSVPSGTDFFLHLDITGDTFGIDINEEEIRTGPDFGCVLWESKV